MNKIFFTLFILYQILYVEKCFCQWSSDPNVNFTICDLNGDQTTPLITAITDGGCYISWFDSRTSGYAMYLQKLNSSGYKQFGNDGLLISSNPQNSSLVGYSLTVDNYNNAVLVFTDIRNSGSINPFAYLISPTGTFLWGANGVTLTDSVNSYQPNPKAAVTSDGNYVFAWQYGSGPTKIAMQKLNSSGAKQWGNSPLIITSNTAENYTWVEMVPSDSGSVILMWSGYTGTLLNPQNYKIYTQKFSASGTRVWNTTQDTIYSLGRVSGYYNPRIFSDGNYGAIYCWRDDRNYTNLQTGYVQRKNSSGATLFPVNGSAVSTLSGNNHFDPVAVLMQSTGETYAFFTETNSLQNQFAVYGQKFSSNGARLWTDNGMSFVAASQNQPSFISVFCKDTNVVVHFMHTQTITSTFIKGFMVNRSGTLQWGGQIITLSSVSSEKLRMQSCMNSAGMSMLTWSDRRLDNGGIYAQNINYDGLLGLVGIKNLGEIPTEFKLFQNYPNPFNTVTKIKFSLPSVMNSYYLPLQLKIYDILGREVTTLINQHINYGIYEIDWNAEKYSSGIYIYKLTAGSYSCINRMCLIK